MPGTTSQPDPTPTGPRRALIIGAACLLAVAALVPVDTTIAGALRDLRPGGDLRRELEALQQFGAVSSLLIVIAAIGLLDPRRFRRTLDLLLAMGATLLVVKGAKILAGRARPVLDDAGAFHGPLAHVHTVPPGDAPISSWQIGAHNVEQLWSMPSSHTASAVVLALFLARLYPRLTPLCAVLASVVAIARVWLGAHWPSDVVAGAGLAWLVASPIVSRQLGVRLLDAVWIRWIDPGATPAYRPPGS